MATTIGFDGLETADLVVDAVYEGGTAGNVGDDPLNRLLPCGNQGGFRYAGSPTQDHVRMVLLYTRGDDPDWPDILDRETGLFTYFGDNRTPGKEIHETPRLGNLILRSSFDRMHGAPPQRHKIPPFFVFSKAHPVSGRAVRFLGLAVPGAQDLHPTDDLVAIWRTSGDIRFQNYRAMFTILDVPVVSRAWIEDLADGCQLGPHAPKAFKKWVQTGTYMPLESPRNIQFRTKQQQMPDTPADRALVQALIDYFPPDGYAFEACAVELWKMQAREAVTFVATRRSADGGRDAFGWYFVGPDTDRIRLEWSLEAKRYSLDNGAGVKQTSRLISRLRHREFGVFVTTSFVSTQAYEELRGDKHPVVVIAARDIATLLKAHGMGTKAAVLNWLQTKFPLDDATPPAS